MKATAMTAVAKMTLGLLLALGATGRSPAAGFRRRCPYAAMAGATRASGARASDTGRAGPASRPAAPDRRPGRLCGLSGLYAHCARSEVSSRHLPPRRLAASLPGRQQIWHRGRLRPRARLLTAIPLQFLEGADASGEPAPARRRLFRQPQIVAQPVAEAARLAQPLVKIFVACVRSRTARIFPPSPASVT